MMSIDKKNISEFWSWFLQNASRLELVKSAEEPLFRLANAKLREVDPRLCLLFSEGSGSREVVISANGNRGAFGLVECVVESAPSDIPGWVIIAFKAGRGFPKRSKYGVIEVVPEDLWFVPLRKKDDIAFFGLQVGIADYDQSLHEEYRNCTYEVLEIALGEKRFNELVNYVDVGPLPSDPEIKGWARLIHLERFLKIQR